jgi:Pyridoxamine 5'-phosphate oxidase
MYESDAELDELRQLLDRSFATASGHLLSIMTPPRRLDARRIAHELDGPCVLNIATVTAHGEPRISAVDGHFLHGHWYFSTDAASPKWRQLSARPAISASYTPRDGYGVFGHGRVERLQPETAEFTELVEHWALMYGGTFDDYGVEIAAMRIDLNWLVAFAMTAEDMVEIEAMEQGRRERRVAAGR